MNRKNVEGTISLNGLLEGPLPDDSAAEERLRDWVRSLRKMGAVFELEVSAGSFSLLPRDEPFACGSLGDRPHEALSQAFEQLLSLFPAEVKCRTTSTLRSSEFRKGEEVQTLYLVDGSGSIRIEQRTVAAETEAPPKPLTPREVVRSVAIAIVVLAAVLGITSLFVDLPGIGRQLIGTVRPVNVDEVDIDASAYASYFAVEKKEIHRDELRLTLRRTDAFPTTDAALQREADASAGSIRERLAVEALARGIVRCDAFDSEGNFVASANVRVGGLREKETLVMEIPLRTNRRFRLGKIEFGL
jgi:hypothetical protein